MRKQFLIILPVLFWMLAPVALSGENVMKIHDAEANAGETLTLEIEIINHDPFVGFNLDIPLPEGFTYVEGSEELLRDDGHSFSFSIQEGNIARMMAYSIASKVFSGNDGVVVTFDVATPHVPGTFPLEITNAVIAGVAGDNILTGTIDGTVVIEQDEPEPVTVVKVHDASGLAGVPVVVEVEIMNAEPFVGFNADFPFSGDYRYVEGSCEVFRSEDPLYAMGNIEEGLVRLIGVSQSNTPFDGNEGILLRFEIIPPLKEGTFPIPINNVIVADADAQAVETELVPGNLTLDLVVYTVVFHVMDQQGEEIPDATISFGNYHNDPGDYAFDNVPPTSFDFLVQAAGYYDYEGAFEVTESDLELEVVMVPDETSVAEAEGPGLLLYPNPASLEIHVVSGDDHIDELHVYDIHGRLVYAASVDSGRHTINVSSFSSGVYVVRTSGTAGLQTRRFQVSH